jgi:hypothetical protein
MKEWIIGIVTGLISGSVSGWIVSWFFKRMNKEEEIQRIFSNYFSHCVYFSNECRHLRVDISTQFHPSIGIRHGLCFGNVSEDEVLRTRMTQVVEEYYDKLNCHYNAIRELLEVLEHEYPRVGVQESIILSQSLGHRLEFLRRIKDRLKNFVGEASSKINGVTYCYGKDLDGDIDGFYKLSLNIEDEIRKAREKVYNKKDELLYGYVCYPESYRNPVEYRIDVSLLAEKIWLNTGGSAIGNWLAAEMSEQKEWAGKIKEIMRLKRETLGKDAKSSNVDTNPLL